MPYYDANGEEVAYDPAGYGGDSAAPSAYVGMPSLGGAIRQNKGILGPGVKAGMYDIGGALGAGVGAVGGALGVDSLRDWGIGLSDKMQAASQAAGRPEYEVMPWNKAWGEKGQTLGDVPAWAAYQVAKQIPQMGAAVVGGGLVGAGMKAAGMIAPGAEMAATLPAWMGGGALQAGASAVEREAAMKAGQDLAQRFMGTTVAGLPQAAGSMYQSEIDRSREPGQGPLSQGAAMASLGLAPVYSALDAATPTETVGMVKRGLAGNLPRRLATAALSEGAQEMVQEGLQTGMEMGFRPDLPMADKAQNIIDAALVGGLVGGVFGSVGGIRRVKSAHPADVSDADMEDVVDEATLPTGGPTHSHPFEPAVPMTNKELNPALGQLKGQDLNPTPTVLEQIFQTLNTTGNLTDITGSVKKLKRLGLVDENSIIVKTPEAVMAGLEARLAAAKNDKERADLQRIIDNAQQWIDQRNEYFAANGGAPAPAPAAAPTPAAPVATPPAAPAASAAAAPPVTPSVTPPAPPPAAVAPVTAPVTPAPMPVVEEELPETAPYVAGATPAEATEALPTGTNPDVDYLTSLPTQELGKLQREIKAAGPDGMDVGESLTVAYEKGQGYFYQDASGEVSNAFANLQELVADLAARNAQEARLDEEAAYDQDWPGYIKAHEEARLDEEAARDQNWPATFAQEANPPVSRETPKTDETKIRQTPREAFLSMVPEAQHDSLDALLRDVEGVARSNPSAMTPENIGKWAENHGIEHLTEPLTNYLSTLAGENAAARQKAAAAPAAKFNEAAANEAVAQQKKTFSPETEAYFRTDKTGNTISYGATNRPSEQVRFQPGKGQVNYTTWTKGVGTTHTMAKENLATARAAGVPKHIADMAENYINADKAGRAQVRDQFLHNWKTETETKVQAMAAGRPAAAVVAAQQEKAQAAKPAKPFTQKQQKAVATAESLTREQQAMVKAVGKAFTNGRWHDIIARLQNIKKEGGDTYEAISKASGMSQTDLRRIQKWANNPGVARQLLGYALDAAKTGWLDADTKDIAIRFLDNQGDVTANETIAAAEQALEGKPDYANRLALVRNLVANTNNLMKRRVTAAENANVAKEGEEPTEEKERDLAPYAKKMTAAHQAQFEKIGPAAQRALDRMARSGKKTGEIYNVLTNPEEFRYHSTGKFVTPAMIEDYVKSIEEPVTRSPVVEPRPLRKGDPEKLAQEKLAYERANANRRRGNFNGIEGVRFGKGAKFFFGPVGEPKIELGTRMVNVWRSETLGNLHKDLLKLSDSKALRQLAPLVRRIANTPVVYVSPGAVEAAFPGAGGLYDVDAKMIILPDLDFLTPNEEAHRALHEAVHAALHDVLDSNPEARAELMKIADALKASGLVNKEYYALKDPHEFLSEALSNLDMQQALEKLKMPDQRTGWRAFVAKVLEWLGWKGAPNAFDAVLRVQERLEAQREAFDLLPALKEAYGKNLDGMLTDSANADENRRLLAIMADKAMGGADTALSTLIRNTDAAMQEKFGKGTADAAHWWNKLGLHWSSFGHILQQWGKLFGDIDSNANPVAAYGSSMRQRNAITFRLARLFGVAHDKLEELDKAKPHMQLKEKLSRLMAITTEFGLDPEKKWDDIKNTKRMKQMAHGDADRLARFKQMHAEAVELKNYLSQNGKTQRGSNVYRDYRELNAMLLNANQAVMLYNLVSKDPYFGKDTKHARFRPSLDRAASDPVAEFLKQKNLHEDPTLAAQFWAKEIDARMASVNTYLAHMATQKARLNAEDWKAYETSKKPLTSMMRDLERQLNAMREAPYFHLGRHGQFIARFDMKPSAATRGLKDKMSRVVDQATIDEVSRRLEKVHPDAAISPENDRTRVMIRFESKDQRDKVIAELKKMQAEGLVEDVQADARDDFREGGAHQPAWLEQYIAAIQSNSAFSTAQKQQMVSIARTTWLDQLSDTAAARVMAQRQFIPGYNRDMLRNFAFRAEVGINSLANMSVAAKIADAFEKMKTLHEKESFDNADKADLMHQAIQELQQRDAERPMVTGKDWLDTWRSINQSFFLGMSPAYTLVNMSQLGIMLLPELAKKHGFVKAAKIIAAVTPKAFKIIKETYTEGSKISFSRSLDAVITGDVLARSGLDADMLNFLTRMVNSGNIDLGSPMREMGRTAQGLQGDKMDFALRFASSMGYYSETLTRLIAAMSAHELSKGTMSEDKIDIYAGRVLDDAMLNYSNWYTARATGKMGVLGRFTPIPASFQQYTLQVMQKLYRELGDAFGAQQEGETPDDAAKRRSEARTFLIGHATVLSLLAGTLGMPFTTAGLALVDTLRSALGDGDEPPDTKADYLNYLTYVFGKEAAEMIAHGLPRGLGFDISGRAGEQDMAPLSRFFADKRKMEDAVKDLVFRSAGSPVSMLAGMVTGGSEMAQGNFMAGLQMMVPNSIKGGLKAYDMATKGYHDANGTPLPITADNSDIAMQALGLTPADKAQYSEGNLIRSTRKTILQRRANQLRNTAVEEIRGGGLTPETLEKIQKNDTVSAKTAVLPTLGSTIARRQRQEILAKATGLPLGADPFDQGERARLGFVNLRR